MAAQIKLYLSWRTDQDLIALYQNIPSKDFNKAVKEALRMLFRPGYQTSFFYGLKTDPSWKAKRSKKADDKKEEGIEHTICLRSVKDQDIREVISNAEDRRAAWMVKMALRFALGSSYVIGSCLKTQTAITPTEEYRQIIYIQNAPRRRRKRLSVFEEDVKEQAEKDVVKIPSDKKEKEQKDDTEMGGFALPGLSGIPAFGSTQDTEDNAASDDDEFTDDDILSMLENM